MNFCHTDSPLPPQPPPLARELLVAADQLQARCSTGVYAALPAAERCDLVDLARWLRRLALRAALLS